MSVFTLEPIKEKFPSTSTCRYVKPILLACKENDKRNKVRAEASSPCAIWKMARETRFEQKPRNLVPYEKTAREGRFEQKPRVLVPYEKEMVKEAMFEQKPRVLGPYEKNGKRNKVRVEASNLCAIKNLGKRNKVRVEASRLCATRKMLYLLAFHIHVQPSAYKRTRPAGCDSNFWPYQWLSIQFKEPWQSKCSKGRILSLTPGEQSAVFFQALDDIFIRQAHDQSSHDSIMLHNGNLKE